MVPEMQCDNPRNNIRTTSGASLFYYPGNMGKRL
jgi:hypothetical protein